MRAICLLPFLVASVLGGTTLLQTNIPTAMTYTNLNLNVPAPVPEEGAPAQDLLVQRHAVKGLGRPSISYTPLITEVRPELEITENSYDVPVPKPVFKTQEVTPVVHKHVPEPYAVPQPYAVPKPYAVPQPYNVPVPVPHPVHVQHHAVAAPAPITYAAGHLSAASVAHVGAVGHWAGAPITYGAAITLTSMEDED